MHIFTFTPIVVSVTVAEIVSTTILVATIVVFEIVVTAKFAATIAVLSTTGSNNISKSSIGTIISSMHYY